MDAGTLLDLAVKAFGALGLGAIVLSFVRKEWRILIALGVAAGSLTYALAMRFENVALTDDRCRPNDVIAVRYGTGPQESLHPGIALGRFTAGPNSVELSITNAEVHGAPNCEDKSKGTNCFILDNVSSGRVTAKNGGFVWTLAFNGHDDRTTYVAVSCHKEEGIRILLLAGLVTCASIAGAWQLLGGMRLRKSRGRA